MVGPVHGVVWNKVSFLVGQKKGDMVDWLTTGFETGLVGWLV